MSFIADASWMRTEWWPLLLLPALAALLGGMSNWLSLRLLFGPVPMPGGSSGVLVRHSRPAADNLAASLASQLPLRELFRLMEPEKIAAYVCLSVSERLDEHIDSLMAERHAVLWANLPQLARQRVYRRVKRQLPAILDHTIEDMGENIDELVDIRQLIDSRLAGRRDFLAQMFRHLLESESRFLIRAGIWTGLVLGLLLAVILRFHPSWALLAVLPVGVAVASVLLPRSLLLWAGGDDRPGLSRPLRRDRPRLAEVLAHRFAVDFFNLQHLMQEMLFGVKATRSRAIIRRHMRPLLEAGMVRTTLQVTLGMQAYARIKQVVVDRLIELTAEALSDVHFIQQRGGRVENAACSRLAAMSPREVRRLVQPVLDDGLWWRVLAVTLLGGIAGVLQLMLVQWLLR